jgi:cytochrome c-type biogenesis protein CcmF
MVAFGFALLVAALAMSAGGVVALLGGHWASGGWLTKVGRAATWLAAAALTGAITVLTAALLATDWHFLYVFDYQPGDASPGAWPLRLSGLWAGREGSLLLWAWLLALFSAWIAWRDRRERGELTQIALAVTNAIVALFSAAMVLSGANNPFLATPASYFDASGRLIAVSEGMSPLLRHWAMILHPPALFIGYAGLTVPFAFAVAALLLGDGSQRWVDATGRIAVLAWLFLGAGIGLGSVWAYVVLGWGGYWGWDPVENASLLPWLAGVGLIHSLTVYRKRGGFKRWAIALSGVTFAFVVLGTFITRTGIVHSQHSFQPDPVSYDVFLCVIVGTLTVTFGGLAWRWKAFAGADEFESLASREAAYYFNNVLMLVAGVLVAYLTLSSALPASMPFGHKAIPPSSFDAIARPVGVLYALILAACPLLSWRRSEGSAFWQRAKWPLVGAAALFALLLAEFAANLMPIYRAMMVLGVQNSPTAVMMGHGPFAYYAVIALLGLMAAALIIANAVALFVTGTIRRAEATGCGLGKAFLGLLAGARQQSGGYLAHLGIGIILIGLVGSAMFVYDNTYLLPASKGVAFPVDDYAFAYAGHTLSTASNGDQTLTLKMDVTRGGKAVRTVVVKQTQFAEGGEIMRQADVVSEPLRDVFASLQGVDGNSFVVNVKVNPLISLTWTGFVVLLLGGGLASWPARRKVASKRR